MARRLWLAALMLLGTGLAHADDPVAIDVKDRGEGEIAQVEQTDTEVHSTKLVDHDGKTVQEANVKVVFSYVYRETLLARDKDKTPTRMRREYEKAQATCDGMTSDLSFQGKTVLIERKDGDYRFSIENGKVVTEDPEIRSTLGTEFNAPKLEYKYRLGKESLPGKPVSLNDPWTIDVKSIIEAGNWGGWNYDTDKATGTGTLLKVYSKAGKQFGSLHVHITAPLKSFGFLLATPALDGSKSEIEEDIEACIDGQEATAVYKTKRVGAFILQAGNGRAVGVSQTSDFGPVRVQRNMDTKDGQLCQTVMIDSVKSVCESPKK